jgi:hypothetical protein
LCDLSDIGTFTCLVAGVKRISVATISGAVLGIRSAFREDGAVIEVAEKAGMNRNRGLTSQMVEKKIAQLKIAEINLIANKIEVMVFQEFFSG